MTQKTQSGRSMTAWRNGVGKGVGGSSGRRGHMKAYEQFMLLYAKTIIILQIILQFKEIH